MGASISAAGADALAFALWVALAGLLAGYLAAARRQRQLGRWWSAWRGCSFAAGIAILALALSPVLRHWAHHDLRGHMVQHLLLGMLAPLALVLAAPATLLLRSIPVGAGRQVAAVMRSRRMHWLTRPAAALILDTGGLYALYLTPLFAATLSNPLLHVLVHVHFLAAGYLFVWSIAGPDPAPSRPGMRERLIVLGAAIAAHSTLAKIMYAYGWPRGTPYDLDQIRAAAQVMYYGGDIAELMLAIALFADWYRSRAEGRYALRSLPRDQRSVSMS